MFLKINYQKRTRERFFRNESQTSERAIQSYFAYSEGLPLCKSLEIDLYAMQSQSQSCEIDSRESGSNLLPSSWKPKNLTP